MRITVNDVVFGLAEVDQLCSFLDAQGFAVLRGLYDEATLDECQHELTEVYRRVADAPDGSDDARFRGSIAFPEPEAYVGGQRYTHMVNRVAALSPLAQAVYAQPVFAEVARRILGPDALLPRGALNYQDARSDASSSYTRLGWHTDGDAIPDPYRDLLPQLTITVHLDATSPANGFLRVVPGSHNQPRPDPAPSFEHIPGEVLLFADRGDVLFHHSELWHSAARGSADGELGARRHIRAGWNSRKTAVKVTDIDELRKGYQMPRPAAR